MSPVPRPTRRYSSLAYSNLLCQPQAHICMHATYACMPTPRYSSLAYSNLLCGVLRGALEMVQSTAAHGCTATPCTLPSVHC